MRLFCPFTEIQPATRISLRDHAYTPVLIEGPNGYRDYFRERWAEAQTFIQVEHDVVVWPGALEQLDECSSPWCAFGYSARDLFALQTQSPFPYLGAVKFSGAVIGLTRGAWDLADDWRSLDRHIARVIREAGVDVHQHFPGVVNANPVLL